MVSNMEFTKEELEQIHKCLQDWEELDEGGWYYGNKKIFYERHETIKAKIKNLLGSLEGRE